MSSPSLIRRKSEECSGDDERECPFPSRFGEGSDVAMSHCLNTLQGEEEQPSVPKTDNEARGLEGNEEKESSGRLGEADTEVGKIDPVKNTRLPTKDDEQTSVPNNNYQDLKPNQGLIRNRRKEATTIAELEGQELTGKKESPHLATAANQALQSNQRPNRNQRKVMKSAQLEGDEVSQLAGSALIMADVSDSSDDSSDDDDEYEQRPGAIAVPGLSGGPPSRSFSLTQDYSPLAQDEDDDEPVVGITESATPIEDVPIIAELTEDIEERLEKKVLERIVMEVEERLRNQTIAEAVEVKPHKNKQWFEMPLFWFLLTIGIVCTIAITLGVIFSNNSKSRSDATNGTNTTIPFNGTTSSTNKSTAPMNGSSTSSNNPTMSPSDSSKFTFEELVEWLGPNVTDDIGVFDNKTTPQYLAMYWLAINDTFVPDNDELSFLSATLDQIYLERYVLAVMFYAFHGASWHESLNFLSSLSVCKWNNPALCSPSTISDWICLSSYGYGVECNDNMAITLIYLEDVGLIGSIPSEIGLLTSLEQIRFGNNYDLTGSLPATIFELTNLGLISAYNNRLTGTISPSIGKLTNLFHINLERTLISGDIPFEEIGKHSHLDFLQLAKSSFTGSIASKDIAKLTNLQYLELTGSSIEGPIPSTIQRLSKLTHLALDNNNFTGSIPIEIFQLSNLGGLNLEKNYLNGTIPSEIGLIRYPLLDLSQNSLSGMLPSEFGELTQLTSLDLSHNNFSGVLPSELGLLSHLRDLDLSVNRFSGTVPVELGGLNSSDVFLWENNFTGSLDDVFCGVNNTNQVFVNCVNKTNQPPELQCSCCCSADDYYDDDYYHNGYVVDDFAYDDVIYL